MKKDGKHRKGQRLLLFMVLFAAIAGTAFFAAWKQGEREEHSEKAALDLWSARLVSQKDTHGGFHGDGTSLFIYAFDDDRALNEIKNSPDWRPLPFDKMEEVVLYGVHAVEEDGMESQAGPIFKFNNQREPVVPRIENGFVKVLDRHSEGNGQTDYETIFGRGSINLTVMLYDTDENLLYICEMDT